MACALLAAGTQAFAAPPAANAPAMQVPAALPTAGLRAAGTARLRAWGIELYDATLFVAPGFRHGEFASHAFALELRYLRPFTSEDIARASLGLMRRAGPIDEEQAARWQAALQALLPDVRRGDRLTGAHRPGAGVRFALNGRWLGEIADPRFAALFFSIWLAEGTSEPGLRLALLADTPP